jgi:hypothetical protein
MVSNKTHIILRVLFWVAVFIVVLIAVVANWVVNNYQQQLARRLPLMMEQATDSVYHVSWAKVHISFLQGRMTLTGLRLVPDKAKWALLRGQHKRVPPTLSTLFVPRAEVYGISWWRMLTDRSLNCDSVAVYNGNWLLECTPQRNGPPRKKHTEKAKLKWVSAGYVHVYNPEITYSFNGPREHFTCVFNGGQIQLHQWLFNTDRTKDTCSFLYAQQGAIRLQQFRLFKSTGTYFFGDPALDFQVDKDVIAIKGVNISHMTNTDPISKGVKEVYDLKLPRIEVAGLNWNRLIERNILHMRSLTVHQPDIHIRYQRVNDVAGKGKVSSYPHQLLLQAGLQTQIEALNVQQGRFSFTEVTKDNKEANVGFEDIHSTIDNITNVPDRIQQNDSCVIHLKGKFQGKSTVTARFGLWLGDTSGSYTMNGNIANLDGKDVIKQVQAFTIIAVTSFHMDNMEIHIQGNGHFITGQFTPRYNGLKISLAKFKSEKRSGSTGLFSFMGNLVLYPNNPMPGGKVRSAATSLARDPEKGFIGNIWHSIYRGAKKAAVREKAIVTVTDGRENKPGDNKVHKGLLKRIFRRK